MTDDKGFEFKHYRIVDPGAAFPVDCIAAQLKLLIWIEGMYDDGFELSAFLPNGLAVFRKIYL